MQASKSSVPDITILLPTFNRPKHLRNTVEQLKSQTYSNFKVVISDNCSTNPEVASYLNSISDTRFKVVIQKENIGVIGNIVATRSYVDTPFFIWISDDDWRCERWLELLRTDLLNNNQCISII